MDRVIVYRDRMPRKGKWRWRLVAANGNILADSGQGYAAKEDAVTMAARIIISGHYSGAVVEAP